MERLDLTNYKIPEDIIKNGIIGQVEDIEIYKFKTPPHEISACVDEIIKICPVTKQYSYTYWLRKVKKSGLNLYQVEQLLAKSQELDKKYNQCGFISNKLTK